MSDREEQPPPHTVIRIVRRHDPVSAVTEDDAQRRAARYSELRWGAPVFGHAEDLGDGRWRVYKVEDSTPQDARDGLAHHLRVLASQTSDEAAGAELTAAYELLDWEKVDEMTVAGSRYRIVRVQPVVRFGPDGPEPPRPSDPDPRPAGEAPSADRRGDGLVIDPSQPVGVAEALLKMKLLPANYSGDLIPTDVYEDSKRAVLTHPGGVFLPVEFTVAERIDGRWRPITSAHATPQSARESITFDLRYLTPKLRQPSPADAAEYARAADELDTTRANELTVLARHFRVARVENLLRWGPDGPEPPRPSDHDPEDPPAAAYQQFREQGLIDEPD